MNVRHDMVTVFVARPAGTSHEFLQLRRVPVSYMGGTWQTVRGKIKAGETAVQGALRELREETGLTPIEFYRVPGIESFYTQPDDTIWHNAAFFAIVDRAAPITFNHEHDAHRWVPAGEVDAHFMWPDERRLIGEIVHEILGNGLAKLHLIVPLQTD
jgi:dATP pyrophosphohydrolase